MEYRIYSPRDLVGETANLRQELARAMEVLALPIPDTFLGRSHGGANPLRWYQYERADGCLADAILRPPSPESNGASLADLLQGLVHIAIEQAKGKARAAFYLANSERTALHHITGMTPEYARCVDGFAISPLSLACGLAAATRHAVITPDVLHEPSWNRWRWLAKEFDYRACWSFPIETPHGKTLGTFATYYKEPTEAKPRDFELASVLTRVAAKVISKY
jgi:hypothetical protein